MPVCCAECTEQRGRVDNLGLNFAIAEKHMLKPSDNILIQVSDGVTTERREKGRFKTVQRDQT